MNAFFGARSLRVFVLFSLAAVATIAASAATIQVNDATDTIHNSAPTDCAQSGVNTCSLRDAILFANANGPGPHTVSFSTLPAGTHTITLAAANGGLDIITVQMTIDGTTHPDGRVELDGHLLSSSDGLRLSAQCTIKGMVINRFPGDGIHVNSGGAGSLISSNYCGTDFLGATASANGGNGVTVNATGVTVNGNVLSGNGQAGLDIEGNFLPTVGAVNVQSNKIGTDPLGATAIGNTSHGVWIRIGANGNIIGGGNVISGNGGYGIFLDGSSSAPNANNIAGNFIGTRIAGLGALPNALDGIRIDNSNLNVIGTGAVANIISGNTGNGISVHNSDGNQIFANLIGIDATAVVALGDANGLDGILIDLSTNTTVGGTIGVATRNVISGNTGAGVHIKGTTGTTTGNVVEGNFIGTNIDGSDSNVRPNAIGVYVEGSSAANNSIGGATASRANTIAWNTGAGIRIGATAGDSVTNTAILMNSIHDNGALGIDLGNDGVTANDVGDFDSGANALQNFPVLTHALVSLATGKIAVAGSQDSLQPSNEIQIFLADGDASLHGEGKTFLLDGNPIGSGTFLIGPTAPPVAVAVGNLATATATTADGTSEFAQNLAFVANVPPIANAGPNQPSVTTGATVTLDGSASADPDGQPFSATIALGQFTWNQTGGPAVVLSSATGPAPTFVAAAPGSYVFSLVVSDGMDVSTNSAIVTITVKSSTTTSVVGAPNPSVFGQSVTFTATVTGTTPTGTVTFMDGASSIGTGTLNGSGQATLTTPALSVGSHSITAVYAGDTNFTGSTSAPATQVVNPANTVTTVLAAPNPSVFGQVVTFTATVTAVAPGAGTPAGTVTFFDGIVPLAPAGPLNGSAQATLTTSALSVGSHSITAVYSGDPSFNASTSGVTAQVVNQAATTTAVGSNINPSVVGQIVTFTATVSPTAPGAGTPTGTVTFFDGATSLGPGTLNGSAQATLSTAGLTLGTHAITAVYGGDADFTGGTSPVLSQVVNAAALSPSTTSLAPLPNPSVFGQPVTFTATVSGGGITPTGTVTFLDGATSLGGGLLNGSGQATLLTSALAVGSHSMTATYPGDATYAASASPIVTQVVNKADTTSTVGSSVNPSTSGQLVTFTATVTATAPGAGTPTGTVTFFDGATSLGGGLLNGSGQATLTTGALTVATHSITAAYAGDGNFNTSTSTVLSQVVNAAPGAPSATALAAVPNPSVFGQLVTFTATVTGGGVTPTGTVTFLDGATTIGTGLLNGSGQATFSTSALAVGSHSITASYPGDVTYAASASAIVTQVVNKAATTTAVASSVNPSTSGQSVTFTATVTAIAPGAGTPTGTVTFLDGATTIGTGLLNGSGQATFSTSALAVGSHSITATYPGDAAFAASASPIATQVVNKAATTTAVVSSVNPSTSGQSVTFTATVTATAPGAGTPTGTVTFFDGATSLGAGLLNGSGQATLTTAALTVATHPITATYGGDGNFNSSTSAVLSQVVNASALAASATALSSNHNPAALGQSVTFTATVTGGVPVATGTVTFMDGATVLGTGTLNGSGQATFTTTTLTLGTHTIGATYSGDATYAPSSGALTQSVLSISSTDIPFLDPRALVALAVALAVAAAFVLKRQL